jgi:hypothetical protein
MSFVTRLVPLFALLVTAFCGPALAWDYEVGTSLVCDTRAQVERFAVLFSGDAPAAIQAINTEEQNPSACALLDVVYVRGAQIAMARHGDNAFEVVRTWWWASQPTAASARSGRPPISRCSMSRNLRSERAPQLRFGFRSTSACVRQDAFLNTHMNANASTTEFARPTRS